VLKIAFWRNKMRYLELKKYLKDFTVFSISDIERIDSNFHRRRLNEWQEKGYIKKIIKGYYIFTDLELNENRLFEIANRIYKPSYISLEIALSYYQLIPESVYTITSVSTRKTYKFTTQIAKFSYRSIKPSLYFRYNIIRYDNKHFKIASVEKAILDYFYLNTEIKTGSDFLSLRINKDVFLKSVNETKLHSLLEKFNQKSLKKRMSNFLEFIKDA
jgi:predicted transcriptional regulator of viral defense system